MLPEQVVPFEITMTDSLADQCREQPVQGNQFLLWRTAIQIRLKTRNYIFSAQQFGNQPRRPAHPQPAALDHGQQTRSGDPEKIEPITLDPAVPGAARPPEALQPMQRILDVVALDKQGPAAQFALRNCSCTTGFEKPALGDASVRISQQRVQRGRLFTPNHLRPERADTRTEETAVSGDLLQKIV